MNTDVTPRRGGWQPPWRLVAAAALGIPFWLSTGTLLPRGCAPETCSWFVTGDPLVALGCLTALLWRRRFPLAVAMTVAIVSTASTLATGAALLALCSLATRRRPVECGVVVLAYVTGSQLALGLYPIQSPPASLWLQLSLPALSAGIAVAIGMATGARRVEVLSLRDRAESAEREQTARAAQVRAQERNRIAREMHDVLAHRISLVAMQAGVLDHRGDLTAEENRVLLRGIADGSHQALEELRDVLGVLRADPDRPEPPQPSLDRIPQLVADARTSGLDVTLTTTMTGKPSDVAGRTCYRILQEGLTNAAKHAPGAHVHITVEGTAGDELHISVRNSPATTRTTQPPASGFGLLGLTERITLAGGRLNHHPTPDNGYLLTARLPWPNHSHEKGV
ncbi:MULTISPECIES: histidine kinase [unclassified Streptomyces]|uniref:sensor histidine kinase n=1 Tax=unclassified Streptomyces TaxID=2593676 RepID=UPI002DDB69DC|nr:MULTISPECIES: histidine kinase [unclassified Streptomyces]WSA96608.1 histidine kinase [Streptomyces sp. NBC_01795]WSB81022.1 histidine kinase [Streptomyces sp. NBC_01775]WSS10767.1 histidine kinase [Streptomyces sp. NBC_01186]WSS39466.1 histidine kinase [Streptomyces sp. NBC_01187]